MNKKIFVLSAQIENNHLELIVSNDFKFSNLVAREQMLVDSVDFAFIYILEKDGDYTYLSLPEHTWSKLNEALLHKPEAYIVNEEGQILLPMFYEELQYLIENIKGNSNYGEEMVEKVESLFQNEIISNS